jgi:hypothetical protein
MKEGKRRNEPASVVCGGESPETDLRRKHSYFRYLYLVFLYPLVMLLVHSSASVWIWVLSGLGWLSFVFASEVLLGSAGKRPRNKRVTLR